MIERKCKKCGKMFYKNKFVINAGEGKYCSKKCYQEDHTKITKCLNCGKEFRAQNNLLKLGKAKFHSYKCYIEYINKNHRLVKHCKICGNKIEGIKSQIKNRKYCS